jgi:coniferyl-aldehyde dehydrogenase|tara:strand:+ start:539 stop:1996 length:1458 start_codon:yes stop_codon:yes gene_type:complete
MGLGNISITGNYPEVSKDTMLSKLSILKEPFLENFNPNINDRIDRIKRIQKLVEENIDAFHKSLREDFGSRHEQLSLMADTMPVINNAKHALKNIKKWVKQDNRKPNFPLGLLGSKAYVQFQPYGVVGIISPWNFPLTLSIAPLIEIFAAGNNAMIKLSEFVPATSELTEKLINKYFTEKEVVIINGGPQTSQSFAGLPFDHLLFTGSTNVAKKVASEAASNLVPMTLELGGKSPAIVSSNAKMKKSVDKIMMGKLLNAGQICVSPDYVFVQEDQTEEFVQHAKDHVAENYPTIKNNPDYTSIIHLNHFERLNELVQDAKSKGATVIEINPAQEDFSQQEHHKIVPTLILNPTDDMKVMKEEIFGPLMPVKTYKDFNETVNFINKNPKALALYYFGDDKTEMNNVLDNTSSGQAVMNDVLFQFSMHDLPFGGVGPSGMGAYHGYDGFKNFSHKRSVLKGQNILDAGKMITAPFTESTEKNIKRLT